jgi:hypothetical protein
MAYEKLWYFKTWKRQDTMQVVCEKCNEELDIFDFVCYNKKANLTKTVQDDPIRCQEVAGF